MNRRRRRSWPICARLGFEARVNTHAHMDHAGGFAELRRATGALLYASAEDAVLLEAGGRGDFFLRDAMIYEPVRVDRRVADGDRVTLGDVSLTAHLTPGHTKGCTSWSFPIVVDGCEVHALIVCSLSTPAYRLAGNDRYPDIVSDYQRTYRILQDDGRSAAGNASRFNGSERYVPLPAARRDCFSPAVHSSRNIREITASSSPKWRSSTASRLKPRP